MERTLQKIVFGHIHGSASDECTDDIISLQVGVSNRRYIKPAITVQFIDNHNHCSLNTGSNRIETSISDLTFSFII